jgi:hypothetical protein
MKYLLIILFCLISTGVDADVEIKAYNKKYRSIAMSTEYSNNWVYINIDKFKLVFSVSLSYMNYFENDSDVILSIDGEQFRLGRNAFYKERFDVSGSGYQKVSKKERYNLVSYSFYIGKSWDYGCKLAKAMIYANTLNITYNINPPRKREFDIYLYDDRMGRARLVRFFDGICS